MIDKIYIDTTFRIEEGWYVPHPRQYEVEITEPLLKAKTPDLSYMIAESISVAVVLYQSGVVDWIIGKGYDQLWEYLKAMAASLPWTPVPRGCEVTVNGADGSVRIEVRLTDFNASNIDEAKIRIKNEIRKKPCGDVIETSSVNIQIKQE